MLVKEGGCCGVIVNTVRFAQELTKSLKDTIPEAEVMEINSNHDTIYSDIEGEYAFVSTTDINIYGINTDDAVRMGFLDPMELGDMIAEEAKRMETLGLEHVAILCQTIAEARILSQLIQGKADAQLVATEKDPTDSKLLIMPVYFAKGLEFDGVIAVEASKPKEDGLLSYILCTRALHCLSHITAGPLIP